MRKLGSGPAFPHDHRPARIIERPTTLGGASLVAVMPPDPHQRLISGWAAITARDGGGARHCFFIQYPSLQEIAMRNQQLRYLYQPTTDRVPRWMRRVWAWF